MTAERNEQIGLLRNKSEATVFDVIDSWLSRDDRRTLRRSLSRMSMLGAGLLAATWLAACGVQGHQQPLPPGIGAMGGAPGSGSGGVSAGTGGQVVGGSGGQPAGSGGVTGGQGGGGGGQTGALGGSTGSGGNTGSGGASGAGVTINGTFVPKEKAIVFIHFGHSNMRGQASNPASLRPFFYNTQAGLWSYQGNNIFVLAKEPTAPESTLTFAGPGTALLKTAAAAVSPSSGYQFISIAKGVGADTTEDYLKTIGGVAGVLYEEFITNKAVQLKGKVTFGAVFVMLGITERHLPTADQPGYPGRVQQIVADIRADLGEPNLPVLFCDYEMNATGDLAPTGAVGVVILPLTRMLPGLISNLALVPTDNIPRADYEDDHHFNMTGHQLWAQSAISLMQTKGWFPWR
jgi:hypothetical protein